MYIKKGNNGGRRPGAGKKKGTKAAHTLETEAYRKAIIDEAIKAQLPVIKALIKQAKAGSIPAINMLWDRVLGKVPDKMEMGGTVIWKVVQERVDKAEARIRAKKLKAEANGQTKNEKSV